MNRIGPDATSLTAVIDAEESVTLFTQPSGPAGLATVVLGDGSVSLAADVAEPDQLVTLRYQRPPARRTDQVLAVLLDRDVRLRLAALALADRGEVTVWSADGEQQDPGRPWARVKPNGGLGRVGRLALASSELTRRSRTPLATAVGLLEIASLTVQLDRDLHPTPGVSSLVAAARDHLAASDPGAAPFDPSGVIIGRLFGLVEGWRRLLVPVIPDAVGPIDELLARLRRWDREQSPVDPVPGQQVAAAPLMAQGGSREMSQLNDVAFSAAFDPSGPPPRPLLKVLIDPDVDVEVDRAYTAHDHLLAEGTGNATGLWLRVFDRSSPPVLTALAPLRADGVGRWSARALLPSGSAPSELLVDVTDSPRQPWRSAATLGVIDAVGLGAEAARLSRAGQRAARPAWARAADAWNRLGDGPRATEARRREQMLVDGQGGHSRLWSGTTDPLAVDLVD